jgi:hypothetical protein
MSPNFEIVKIYSNGKLCAEICHQDVKEKAGDKTIFIILVSLSEALTLKVSATAVHRTVSMSSSVTHLLFCSAYIMYHSCLGWDTSFRFYFIYVFRFV